MYHHFLIKTTFTVVIQLRLPHNFGSFTWLSKNHTALVDSTAAITGVLSLLLAQHLIALGLTQSCAFLFLFLYSRLMTEHVRPSGLGHLYLTLSLGSQSSQVSQRSHRRLTSPSLPWIWFGFPSRWRPSLLRSAVIRLLTGVASEVGSFH